MIKQIKGLIFPALILTIVASFYLLNKDINEYSQIVEEQQVQIDTLKKQLGYHDIRISGQMDTLMVHRSRLEQIKTFLKDLNLVYAYNK
jgi:archaellum component FlaC|tara:strand:- start:830 stop:1096 length:267 start_codon:yes stop_codon:yes gene_type:complete